MERLVVDVHVLVGALGQIMSQLEYITFGTYSCPLQICWLLEGLSTVRLRHASSKHRSSKHHQPTEPIDPRTPLRPARHRPRRFPHRRGPIWQPRIRARQPPLLQPDELPVPGQPKRRPQTWLPLTFDPPRHLGIGLPQLLPRGERCEDEVFGEVALDGGFVLVVEDQVYYAEDDAHSECEVSGALGCETWFEEGSKADLRLDSMYIQSFQLGSRPLLQNVQCV
jgi:hypothetical protein